MQISIIIPAFNEEQFLPLLLEDLKKQTFQDFEIIVADAKSTDRTREIAGELGAKVVEGGLPARGRNLGAAQAGGEFLFFLDSDVRLEPDFLEKAWAEINERFLDLATCEFIPLSDLIVDKVLHDIANFYVKVNQYSDPKAGGFCIMISKRLFRRIGGFNEELKLAEDHDLVKRASVFRPLRVLHNSRVKISVRRLDKEGRVALSRKYLTVEAYRFFRGELKDQVVDYQFGDFKTSNSGKDEKKLLALDRKLASLSLSLNRLKDDLSPVKLNLGVKKTTKAFLDNLEKFKISNFLPF